MIKSNIPTRKCVRSHIKDTMDSFSEFEVEQTDLDYWFNVINEEVFDGCCPSPHLMLVKRQRGSWGYVKQAEYGGKHWVALFMSPKFPTLAAFIQILAHEMVHVWQFLKLGDTGSHNKHFYSWRDRFKEFGLDLRRNY